jgi:hypothetical protein
MTDIEHRLRAAMHAAVDAEEARGDLVGLVMRRHRRRQKLLSGIAVLIALVLAVPAALVLRDVVTSSPPPSTRHSVPRPRHSVPRPKRLPTRLSGLPVPGRTNLQFLASGSGNSGGGASLFSTGTGRTEPITGLPDIAYLFNRVEGGWVAEAFYGGGTGPSYQYFIADGSLTATRIGAGLADASVAASSRAGALWLSSHPARTDNAATTSATAQLVSTAGQPLGQQYHLPAGYQIDRGIGSYLLLNQIPNISPSKPPKTETGPFVSVLWDPRTGRAIRRLDNVTAAGPEQVAWSPDCRGCQMQILNASTLQSVSTPIPDGQLGELDGSFSDDGILLAVQLPSGSIGVYDTQTGALTVIPGTTLSNAVGQDFGWQGGGHRLVVIAGPGDGSRREQLAYWQPGDTRLRLATVRNPSELSQIETGL